MLKNMGTIDRTLRIIVAVVVLILGLTGILKGTALIILSIVAVIFLLTAVVGTCLVYIPFKISTKKKE